MVGICVLLILISQPVMSFKFGEALKCHWCIVTSTTKFMLMVFPLTVGKCYISSGNGIKIDCQVIFFITRNISSMNTTNILKLKWKRDEDFVIFEWKGLMFSLTN